MPEVNPPDLEMPASATAAGVGIDMGAEAGAGVGGGASAQSKFEQQLSGEWNKAVMLQSKSYATIE